jgi:polygalacturonase
MCSGRPWLDVRCNGAVGDGVHDDTSAIQTAINTAVTNNCGIM